MQGSLRDLVSHSGAFSHLVSGRQWKDEESMQFLLVYARKTLIYWLDIDFLQPPDMHTAPSCTTTRPSTLLRQLESPAKVSLPIRLCIVHGPRNSKHYSCMGDVWIISQANKMDEYNRSKNCLFSVIHGAFQFTFWKQFPVCTHRIDFELIPWW